MGTTFKFIYALAMAFAIFVIIGGKFPSVGRVFIAKEPVGHILGDLYQMCDLDRFREKIPVLPSGPNPSLEEADVITLGDSFFNSSLDSGRFAFELGKKMGFNVRDMHSDAFFVPESYVSSYVETMDYKSDRKRILILETVERSIFERAEKYNVAGIPTSNRLDALSFRVLKNNDIEYFFKQNFLVKPLGRRLKNFRFEYLGIVDKSIGAYSLDPDMLFYQRDIEFSRIKKTEYLLESTADSIARLAATLKSRYNIELVYLPIPNKYSVYRGLVQGANPYDDFIPRLCSKLTERGVANLDVYSLYSRYNKPNMPLLYFASDTHYTAHGKAILVDACASLVSSLRRGGTSHASRTVAYSGSPSR